MKALIRFVWTLFTCLLGSLSLDALNNGFIGRNISANCKFGVSILADTNQGRPLQGGGGTPIYTHRKADSLTEH